MERDERWHASEKTDQGPRAMFAYVGYRAVQRGVVFRFVDGRVERVRCCDSRHHKRSAAVACAEKQARFLNRQEAKA